MEANSLVLEILEENETLKMSVFEEKDISSTLRHYSQLSVSFSQIQRLCQEVTSILNKANKKGVLEPDLIFRLKKTGQLLWDYLFTRTVKDKLKSTLAKDLVLSLDEELINIPWELLFDGKDFFCLKFNLGRLVRTKEQVSPIQYRSIQGALKMLILANPTDDLRAAYLEGLYIKNQFAQKRKEISIDFKSTNIDTIYVKKNLCDYDIVHFAGHCEYDSQEIKQSGWVFSDGRFSIQDILSLGDTLALPTLVFSNACYSAKTETDLMDGDYQTKTFDLAQAFLFSGVRLYIGTIRKVEDPVSLVFAKEFYTQLMNGKSIGECLRSARLRLIKEYGVNSIFWASYLLYGDANFVFFRPKSQPSILRFKKDASFYKKIFARLSLGLTVLCLIIFLYIYLPTVNPSAYFLLLKSKKLFQQGQNQAVILNLKKIIKEDPLLLATYPLLGQTYQRLGKREETLKSYFDYALYSQKRQNRKNLASAYIGIGWVYHLSGDYPKAFDFYHQAMTLAKENKDVLNEAIVLRKLAVWYIDKEDADKALELLMKSSEINRQRQHLFEHKYNLACDYFDIGLIFANKEDYQTAREFYQKSQLIFEKLKLKNELSDCYFNLGEIYLYQKQYQKALDSYLKGLKIDQMHDNKPGIASDYVMLGELYQEMDDLKKAEDYFNQAISLAKQINCLPDLASAYYNLGCLSKQQGKINKAREYLRLAQEIYAQMDTPDYQRLKQELLSLDKN